MVKTFDEAYELLKPYPSDFFMSIMLAQWALESDKGRSELALQAFNFTGHKAQPDEWPADRVYKKDTIEDDGEGTKFIAPKEPFRLYHNPEEWAKHHSNWMQRKPSTYARAISAKTVEEQAQALQGTYATDTSYAKKLMDMIKANNLTRFDTKKEEPTVTQKRSFKDVVKQVYGTEVINWDGFKGIGAGNRGSNPKGAIIHNDYGRANGKGYISWLTSSRIPNPSAGYAHYYHDRKYAVRAVPTTQGAWHAGDFARGNFTGHGKPANYGNMQLLGYEVNESLSTTNQEFRLNEEVVFMQVAEDALFYGWEINRGTIWLHNEFTSTSCPHRSWELHVGKGKQYNAANRNILKDYFIGRVKFWVEVLSGKRAVPAKNYLPETGQTPPLATEQNKGTSPHNPQGLKETDLKPYVAPRLPWDKLKAGDTVTLAKNFQWADPDRWVLMQSNKYDELVGKKDVVVEVKQIPVDKQGNHSQTAYKLKNYASWILEEYLEESSASWELVDEKEDDVQPTPPAPSYDGNYVYWDGKKYKVENEIK